MQDSQLLQKQENNKILYGISFDGIPISGLIVEFIKTTEIFQRNGYQIYLDLGYEIKVDKDNFQKPHTFEQALLPHWIQLSRLEGLSGIREYRPILIKSILSKITQHKKLNNYLLNQIESISKQLASLIIAKWEALKVSFVIVENGTLPENIIYTKALYLAIQQYGQRHHLQRFVLWRDHDLIWSSEFNQKKYGCFPYENIPKMIGSSFIQYVVLRRSDKRKALTWSPWANIKVIPNTFSFSQKTQTNPREFRRHYRIPQDAYLIARFTRMIPQKRIDRDLRLISKLKSLFLMQNIKRNIVLFISGFFDENKEEYERLIAYTKALNLSNNVIFKNGLLPYETKRVLRDNQYSVRDLLNAADLCSFLPAYDYDSFGNPIAEAIASKTAYIATSYQAYEEVYASKGLQAAVLPISKTNDGCLTDQFVAAVFELLLNKNKTKSIIEQNYQLGETHFSRQILEKELKLLFSIGGIRENSVATHVL